MTVPQYKLHYIVIFEAVKGNEGGNFVFLQQKETKYILYSGIYWYHRTEKHQLHGQRLKQ